MTFSSNYRGRFAPSPTGPLHFGSLAAAVGSYLDAKHHQGTWLVRMEDLDTPRCVPGASEDILRTLEAFGLYWDDDVGRALPAVEKTMSGHFDRLRTGKARPTVIHQSQRTAAYEKALQRLQAIGAVYPCACTRKEIADSALHGIEGPVYPGTCRNGIPAGREGKAWRVRTNKFISVRPELVEGRKGFDKLGQNGSIIEFDDALQGHITQHLESEIGDFVVKRADGLFAYQLAVVVDDAFQNITHIVRGADLLHSTPRQIYLQRLLGLNTPAYMHLPIAVNAQGEKLSKQTLAPAIATDDLITTLISVLEFLRQQLPSELRQGSVEEVLGWAVAHWQPERLKGCRLLPAPI
jgi:glutamyl-Q tRNA(Asp) synthetase